MGALTTFTTWSTRSWNVAVQRGGGQEPRVGLRERAVRGHGDPPRPVGREPDGDSPELRRERDEGSEHLEGGLVDHRDVHGVRDDAAVEGGDDLLRDDHSCSILRLVGRGREVRGDDDVVEREQRPCVRLGREDVERRACELPGLDRLGKRQLVDERPPCGVDEPRAVAHQRDRTRDRSGSASSR